MAITRAKTSSVAQGPSTKKTLLGGNDVILGGSYEYIASASGTGSSGSIEFSSIPSTYKHLQIRGIIRSSSAAVSDNVNVRFNGDSGGNYIGHYLYGNGSAVVAGALGGSSTYFIGARATAANATGTSMGAFVLDILDYANTNKYKTARTLNGWDSNGSGEAFVWSGLWMNTTAINNVLIYTGSNWTTTTNVALYGIK